MDIKLTLKLAECPAPTYPLSSNYLMLKTLYIESLKDTIKSEDKKFRGSPNLIQITLNSYGIKFENIFFLLLIIFTIIYSGYGLGKRKAMEQEYFYINKNNPQIAYLKFYKNKTISAEYSSLKENIITSIIIDKSPSDTSIKILKRKIGPLKPRDSAFID